MNLVIQIKILTRGTDGGTVSTYIVAEITGLKEVTQGECTEKRIGAMRESQNTL